MAKDPIAKYKRMANLKQNQPKGTALAPRELTLKQALFCLEYVASDGKVAESAIKAGFSEGSSSSIGSQLLEMPKVQSRIQSLLKNRAVKLGADADFVVKELLRVVKQAAKAKDFAGQNRALELIGKAAGMFGPDSSAKVDTAVTVQLNMPPKDTIDKSSIVVVDLDGDSN